MKTTKTNKIPTQTHTKYVSGFTLIELLIVITIIGVLATMVMSSISGARSKARDAQRVRDIRTIQTALEMYYLEHGKYPNQGNWGGTAPSDAWANSGNSSWNTLETMIGVTLPRDPVNFTPVNDTDWAAGPNKRFNYAYIARAINPCQDGSAYMLVYRLEKGNTPPAQSPGVRKCDGTTQKYSNGSITVGMSPMQ